MAVQKTNLVNAFETTLAAQLAAGGTSMNLTADPGVDSKTYFVIDPDNDSNREIVLWTSGTNHAAATVVRDVDGDHGTAEDASTAPTHASGTKVRLAVVKQHIDDVHDRVTNISLTGDVTGTLASTTSSAIASTIAADAVHGSMLNDDAISGQTDLSSGLALTDELLISDAGTLKKGDVSLIADAIDGAGIDASAGTLVNAVIGKQSMWIPAAAMYPTQTNGCAAIAGLDSGSNTGPDLYTLDFDDGSDEHAQFSVAMPSYWNEGTITFKVYWTSEATDTDGVAWGLAGVALADSDSLNTAFGTGVVVTDDAISAAKDLYITAESGAVTIAGSPAAGELCYFDVYRDVSDGNDDMTEDAKLIGIKIFYTIDDVHEA
ncbi:MAG: hypothetical protein CL508_05110 [Actinobacteria bacterium]|nr:hypothetical protein [Actinomycetota bacterium]|tara:strand:+ start:4173 stop:5300 length:1128 start_codon:yes stop_codon:yes gene_type:complete